MTQFITDDFLLETPAAQRLYHEFAADLPIIDFHCHLPPEQIASDHRYRTISEVWLHGDHYKWRAMRSNGVAEQFCTGDASDREKFDQWSATVPRLLRNPLYHWTHLELARYFGLDDVLLSPDTSEHVWDCCNQRLAQDDMSSRGIMRQSNVVLVCTTDDPVDSLAHHRAVMDDPAFDVQVLPTWRPDKGMAVEDPVLFNGWLDRLGKVADMDIGDYQAYLTALRRRHDFFHAMGCRLSDHGIETAYAEAYTESEVSRIFGKLRGGVHLTAEEILVFKSAMLHVFGVMDAERGWTQQFHFGAMRNNNSRMLQQLGPDTGFDSIGDLNLARPLSRLLDRLNTEDKLARTILYNLNPRENALLVTMLGNFQDGSIAGKMQLGSAWWFLDHIDGMERQMEDLSNGGLLSRFVGMVTDSRSFLSYTRHEYFRRILCNLLGSDMARGRIPGDYALAGRVVRDVCYNNAATYFGFDLPSAAAL